jgi:putative ABC transport system ATP-binding protein
MALELQNAGIKKAERWLFRHVFCSIGHNEKVIITGPSGSGKSTLLKALLRFEALTEGTLLWNNSEVDTTTIAPYRRTCAYIGQKAPDFQGTVKEFLYLPFQYKANRGALPTHDSMELRLSQFDFSPDVYTKHFGMLSGGEQQRMCIIQALLLNRTTLMLDEITSSLDAENSARVVHTILHLPDCRVISVTHDHQWLQAGMRILRLHNGTLTDEEA